MLRVIGNLLSDQTVILQKTMDNRTHVINAYMYDDFLYAHIYRYCLWSIYKVSWIIYGIVFLKYQLN